jgi:hypothetical protein
MDINNINNKLLIIALLIISVLFINITNATSYDNDSELLSFCKKECHNKKLNTERFCKKCQTLERRARQKRQEKNENFEGLDYYTLLKKINYELLVLEAKIGNQSLNFIRLGKKNDGGYVVPTKALEAADVLMGYGIFDDISFERDFSKNYNKTSYGFDCGVRNITTGDPKCHFLSECIGSSDYLYKNQKSSGVISSFTEQRQRLNLTNKKILIKMDIEGAEYNVMEDILKYSKDITGIVLEVHDVDKKSKELLKILYSLDENFILVHVHGNNCSGKVRRINLPKVLELTYINKYLVDTYQISSNQKHPLPIDQVNLY